jgi:hypothetical protein
VTTAYDPVRLRGELADLLQETDPDRPLDSLETVVVLSFLRGRGLVPAGFRPEPGEDRPRTIEGWVAWAARRSLAS